MNRDQFAGQWKILKGQVKTKWGKLTDDEITQVNGKFEQLAGLLQKKYGFAKEKASQEIDTWLQSVHAGPSSREQSGQGQSQFGRGQQQERSNTQGQQPQRMFADQDTSSRGGRGNQQQSGQSGKGGFGQERSDQGKRGQQDKGQQDTGRNRQNNR